MRRDLGAGVTRAQWGHLAFFLAGFLLGYWGDVALTLVRR